MTVAETSNLDKIQAGCVVWHKAVHPNKEVLDLLAKLTEEVGEVARALVGELEGRPGRGDVCDEAAECVLVLATLVGRFYPHRDLLVDAAAELDRLWRRDFPSDV